MLVALKNAYILEKEKNKKNMQCPNWVPPVDLYPPPTLFASNARVIGFCKGIIAIQSGGAEIAMCRPNTE